MCLAKCSASPASVQVSLEEDGDAGGSGAPEAVSVEVAVAISFASKAVRRVACLKSDLAQCAGQVVSNKALQSYLNATTTVTAFKEAMNQCKQYCEDFGLTDIFETAKQMLDVNHDAMAKQIADDTKKVFKKVADGINISLPRHDYRSDPSRGSLYRPFEKIDQDILHLENIHSITFARNCIVVKKDK